MDQIEKNRSAKKLPVIKNAREKNASHQARKRKYKNTNKII